MKFQKNMASIIGAVGIAMMFALPRMTLAAPKVYDLSHGNLRTKADVTISGETKNGLSGWGMFSVGDLDNDGNEDVMISEKLTDNGAKFYLFYGDTLSTDSLDLSDADAVIMGDTDNKLQSLVTGATAVSSGDINGDGFMDIVIAATGKDYIIYGDGSRFTGENTIVDIAVTLTLTSYYTNLQMLGDINSDGYADMLFSDLGSNMPYGEVYLVSGQADEFEDGTAAADLATATFSGDSSAEIDSLITHGDINGDGFEDIILTSSSTSATHEADINIFYNPGTSFSGNYTIADADYTLRSLKPNHARTRYQPIIGGLSADGDFNADGYDDLVVGTPSQDAASDADTVADHQLGGNAYILYGKSTQYSGTKLLTTASRKIKGTPGGKFGYSLNYLDFDGDGIDDLLIGANGQNDREYLFKGQTRKYSRSSSATLKAVVYFRTGLTSESGDSAKNIGYSSATADVDGDGKDDILVGSPQATANAKQRAGKTFLVLGQALPIGVDIFEPASYMSSVQALRNGRMRVTYLDGYVAYVDAFPTNLLRGQASLIADIYGAAIVNHAGTVLAAYDQNLDKVASVIRNTSQVQVEIATLEREGSQPDIIIATLDNSNMLRITQHSYNGRSLSQIGDVTLSGYMDPSFDLDVDLDTNMFNIIYDDNNVFSAEITDAGFVF